MNTENSTMNASERAIHLINEFGTKELAIKACELIKLAPYLEIFKENIPDDYPDSSDFWEKYDLYWDSVIFEISQN